MTRRPNRMYLASSYLRGLELASYARQLQDLGFQITSRWHNGSHSILDNPDQATRYALEDLKDLHRADVLVLFTTKPDGTPTRGGHHVEFGIALQSGSKLVIIGPRLNVFHYLPQVTVYESFEQLLDSINLADWLI